MRGHFLRAAASTAAFDVNAAAYIKAVEAADGQSLEYSVKTAINSFVVGCKADGIWNAIKASCILAGARTLAGALVPLAGTAPTNINFTGSDYSRKTGLKGNGTNTYLDTNRNNNADPQDSCHISVYGTTFGETTAAIKAMLGRQIDGYNEKVLFNTLAAGSGLFSVRCQSRDNIVSHTLSVTNGFIGTSRNNSSTIDIRNGGLTVTRSQASVSPSSSNLFVFASSDGGVPGSSRGGKPDKYDDSRLAFYSIGESLDLSLLNARVTALITAFATAIP